MSIPLEQKLDEIRQYLSSPGKKVVLIGEDHSGETLLEICEIVGKTMKIMDQPQNVGKEYKVYLELPRDCAEKALGFKNPGVIPSIQGNIVRFFSLKGVEPNYPMFDRKKCNKTNEPYSRLGDRQYVRDIRALLEDTDVVIGIFGLGHLYLLSELLSDIHPCTVNITTSRGIKAVRESWHFMFPEIRFPDFDRLYPMVIDETAAQRGNATINVWRQAHTQPMMAQKPIIPQKPPKINEATARGMEVNQLKQELTRRQISFAGMSEKEDYVRALVNWKGGKARRSMRRKMRRTK